VNNDAFWMTVAGPALAAPGEAPAKRRIPPRGHAPASTTTLADIVCTRLVRLPSWFTLAQAARIAELRGVEHVLVEAQGRIRGFVDRQALREGKPHDTLARWMNDSETFAEPHLRIAEARALMERQGLSCLLVARGGILLGTVSRRDLDRAMGNDDLRAA
jgi:predicted transcriptional regulator